MQSADEFYRSRHRCQPVGKQPLKDLAGLGGQRLDRIVEFVPVDHRGQSHRLWPTHHGVEQVGLEGMSAASQQLSPDILVEIFGVHQQAIEVEDNGGNGRQRRHDVDGSPAVWLLVTRLLRHTQEPQPTRDRLFD